MTYRQPIDWTSKQLEFQKLKKKVRRLAPKASTVNRSNGTFTVADKEGKSIVREDHLMPPAFTVREAWEQAAVCAHASRVISGNGKAFKASKKARELTAAMESILDDSNIHEDDIINY